MIIWKIRTMENANILLEEKEQLRYKILRHVYELTKGSTSIMLDLDRSLRTTNLLSQETDQGINIQDAIEYLCDEGLIEMATGGPTYSLTHRGRKEVEESIKNPETATEHFSPLVIQQIFNAPVGTVQTGNNNNAYVNQVNNIGTEIQDSIQELKSLISSLPENRQNDVFEVIEDLQAEIANPTKPSRLKSSLIALWQLGRDVAGFLNSVSAIAERFGIDLSGF